MVRVKRGNVTKTKHQKILTLAQGFKESNSCLFKTVNAKVMKALIYSYVGRKRRKQDFRKLWICRVNAISRQYGLNYSQFKNLLKCSSIDLNLKSLSQLALLDKETFCYILETLKK